AVCTRGVSKLMPDAMLTHEYGARPGAHLLRRRELVHRGLKQTGGRCTAVEACTSASTKRAAGIGCSVARRRPRRSRQVARRGPWVRSAARRLLVSGGRRDQRSPPDQGSLQIVHDRLGETINVAR